MVRPASFDRHGMKKGAWSEDEDNKLRAFIHRFQSTKLQLPNWRLLPIAAGLKRCGKSCRLRWVNYLQPGLRKGNFTKFEEDLIIDLHNQHGNKWSAIAAEFPGRTDNDIKNYWHAHIQKRGKGKGGLIGGGGVIATETASQNISCITSDRINQENLESNADSNVAAEFQGTCGVDLPPWFSEEELYGMGLYQNYDMMIMAYNSWNLGAEPLQEDELFHGIYHEIDFVLSNASWKRKC